MYQNIKKKILASLTGFFEDFEIQFSRIKHAYYVRTYCFLFFEKQKADPIFNFKDIWFEHEWIKWNKCNTKLLFRESRLHKFYMKSWKCKRNMLSCSIACDLILLINFIRGFMQFENTKSFQLYVVYCQIICCLQIDWALPVTW